MIIMTTRDRFRIWRDPWSMAWVKVQVRKPWSLMWVDVPESLWGEVSGQITWLRG